MIKYIYNKLNIAGLNPYFIGQHKGICEERFLIVKEGIQMPALYTNKVGQAAIDIIVFVPEESYIKLKEYKQEIKDTLKQESNYLRNTGFETETITDEEKKAYTMSIEYVIQKKLEG